LRIQVEIVDRGSGPPLVLIPGLQGRWEYLRPAVDALSVFFRVLTFSLGSEDLDGYARQVAAVMTDARAERATICGVSFGGLVAVRLRTRRAAKRWSSRRRRVPRCVCGGTIRSTCGRHGSSARCFSPKRRGG
jgi:pimeloyl-ACP methyl ester carboxylesterase